MRLPLADFVAGLVAVLALLAGAVPASAYPGAAPSDPVEGLWINPHHSVAVRNQYCGPAMCGRIVWASAQAQADARDSGVRNLVGLDLLENYRPEKRGNWKGTVLVPDMGHRFSSEIALVSNNELKISGCILHGLICRSQIWTRIGELPK